MRALEARAFAEGVTAAELMEEAGAKIASTIREFFPTPGRAVVHFGKGHNGGDALVAARHLALGGWALELQPAFPSESWSPLTQKHFQALADLQPARTTGAALIILDGLLGIGAEGSLRGPILQATRAINALKARSGAIVFALDLPTGLNGDTGQADPETVAADFTLTIGAAKPGLLRDSATSRVGRLAVLPLRELSARIDPSPLTECVSTAESLRPFWPRRPFELHKGQCGRVAILAGSRGMIGAARMAAQACVHSGAGLVSLYTYTEVQPLLAASTAPEVMVRACNSPLDLLSAHSDVLAIGPGLGSQHREQIAALCQQAHQPMVIDADALNAIAAFPAALSHCAGPRLLTPHPGEMARLDPLAPTRTRLETAAAFTAQSPHVLLLKGARTLVAQQGQPFSYNPTGSPGMASGGMGDLLTGVCAGLAAQGASLFQAARLAAWLCGRAAELALFQGPHSEESLSASTLLPFLGSAFKHLRADHF